MIPLPHCAMMNGWETKSTNVMLRDERYALKVRVLQLQSDLERDVLDDRVVPIDTQDAFLHKKPPSARIVVKGIYHLLVDVGKVSDCAHVYREVEHARDHWNTHKKPNPNALRQAHGPISLKVGLANTREAPVRVLAERSARVTGVQPFQALVHVCARRVPLPDIPDVAHAVQREAAARGRVRVLHARIAVVGSDEGLVGPVRARSARHSILPREPRRARTLVDHLGPCRSHLVLRARPTRPRPREQLVFSTLASSESESAGHGLHGTEPVVFFHVALGQGRHSSRDTPKSVDVPYPGTQEQLPISELPDGEIAFGVHSTHDERLSEAIRVENVCSSHSVHAADPLTSLYVPAGQPAQAWPSGPV
eukprot:582929-Rhodomonas_salina.4